MSERPIPEGGLCVTCKPGEGVWIGETYVEFHKRKGGNQVMLRIVANPSLVIVRQEFDK